MAILTLRNTKGTPLTHAELDANFTNLNTDKAPYGDPVFTGNVGIGGTPGARLGIIDATSPAIQLRRDGSNEWFLAGTAVGENSLAIRAGSNLAANTKVTVTSAGNVGVGITLPTFQLDVRRSTDSSVANFQQTGASLNTDIYINNAGSANNFIISRRSNGESWLYNSGADALVLHTAATERMRITSAGDIGIGITPTVSKLQIYDGSLGDGSNTSAYLLQASGVIPANVTNTAYGITSSLGTAAAAFTLAGLQHYVAAQTTLGAGSAITNQYGFTANNTLVGALGNFGFYGTIPTTTATITFVALTSNVATITTSAAHGYLAGMQVVVAATTNTSLNGTYTVATAPTTTTFTFAKTQANIVSVADTGSVTSAGRWNAYMSGTAPNYFAGNVGVGTIPTIRLDVSGTTSLVANFKNTTAASTGEVYISSNDRTLLIGQRSSTNASGDLAYIYSATATPIGFYTTALERMRIDASGNVGIGTGGSTIGNKLTLYVGGATAHYMQVANGSTGIAATNGLRIGVSTAGLGEIHSVNALTTTVAGVERMRIDSSGNVGVGNTPAVRLDVSAATSNVAAIRNSAGTGSNLIIADTGSSSAIGTNNGNLILYNATNTTERMRIDSSGNLGVGTAGPTSRLDVVQGSGDGGIQYRSSTRTVGIGMQSSEAAVYWGSTTPLTFTSGGLERMRIDSSGNVGIGVAPSAWGANPKSLSLKTGAFVSGGSTGYRAHFGLNAYESADDVWRYIAAVNATRYSQIDGRHEWYSSVSGIGGNVITFNQAMILDGSSNLGLGIATPSARLHVASGGNKWATFESTNVASSFLQFMQGASASVLGYLGSDGAAALSGGTGTNLAIRAENALLLAAGGNTERMRITAAGDVGIGTTAPTQRLSVSANATFGAVIGVGPTGAYDSSLNHWFSGNSAQLLIFGNRFYDTGTAQSRASSAGFAGSLEYDKVGGAWTFNTTSTSQTANTALVNNAERMRIDSSGDVMVNRATTSGLGRLQAAISTGNSIADFSCSSGSAGLVRVRATTADSAYLLLQNSNTGTAISDGLQLGIDSAGQAYVTNNENAPLIFQTNAAERMRIDSSGNVGIGAAPGVSYTLDVFKSANNLIRIRSAATSSAAMYLSGNGNTAGVSGMYVMQDASNNGYVVNESTGGMLALGTAGQERMRIDSSGNVLVGATSTTPSSSNGVIVNVGAGNTAFMHTTGTVTGTLYQGFYLGGTAIGTITQSGTTAVLYNTTSDGRLKTNVAPAADAGALLDTVQVRQFDWLADGSHQRFGFIAQELVEVVPEAVHAPADPDDMMAVDYSKLVPLLVKEIQSLRARVTQLETKV